MTKLVPDGNDFPRLKETTISDGAAVIQSSMTSYEHHSSERKFNVSLGKLGSYSLLCLYTYPTYVTIISTLTSFSYTTTKTFTITNCVPQPFSYSICSTINGKR